MARRRVLRDHLTQGRHGTAISTSWHRSRRGASTMTADEARISATTVSEGADGVYKPINDELDYSLLSAIL